MKQEDKELLLKDLCARLPYKCKYKASKKITHWHKLTLNTRTIDKIIDDYYDEIKPYLRPMSSMTEEECIALSKLIPYKTDAWKYIKTPIPLYIANIEQFDFFHRHHLDWRGLISKGLAIEVTEENNPYKE